VIRLYLRNSDDLIVSTSDTKYFWKLIPLTLLVQRCISKRRNNVRPEIFTAVSLDITVYSDATPCSVVKV
jgi:hypothetical protein